MTATVILINTDSPCPGPSFPVTAATLHPGCVQTRGKDRPKAAVPACWSAEDEQAKRRGVSRTPVTGLSRGSHPKPFIEQRQVRRKKLCLTVFKDRLKSSFLVSLTSAQECRSWAGGLCLFNKRKQDFMKHLEIIAEFQAEDSLAFFSRGGLLCQFCRLGSPSAGGVGVEASQPQWPHLS